MNKDKLEHIEDVMIAKREEIMDLWHRLLTIQLNTSHNDINRLHDIYKWINYSYGVANTLNHLLVWLSSNRDVELTKELEIFVKELEDEHKRNEENK